MRKVVALSCLFLFGVLTGGVGLIFLFLVFLGKNEQMTTPYVKDFVDRWVDNFLYGDPSKRKKDETFQDYMQRQRARRPIPYVSYGSRAPRGYFGRPRPFTGSIITDDEAPQCTCSTGQGSDPEDQHYLSCDIWKWKLEQ